MADENESQAIESLQDDGPLGKSMDIFWKAIRTCVVDVSPAIYPWQSLSLFLPCSRSRS